MPYSLQVLAAHMGALCHTYIPYMYPSYTPYASRTPDAHLTYLSPSTLSLIYIPHTYALHTPLPSGPGSTHGRLVIQSSLKCIPHIRVSPPLQVLGAHMGAAGYTGILQILGTTSETSLWLSDSATSALASGGLTNHPPAIGHGGGAAAVTVAGTRGASTTRMFSFDLPSLSRSRYMYALYVCLLCMPYMYALYVRLRACSRAR